MEHHPTAQQPMAGQWAAKLGVGATAGVIAVPYVPAMFGAPSGITTQILNLCQSSNVGGTGLTALANQGLSHVPMVGASLAAGGWFNAISSGVLGIGGTLLGNYVHTHYDRHGHIPWGRVIKYAAIATSMLIALPSLLSGISMGLTFLAFAAGGAAFASSVAGVMSGTLGLMGTVSVVAAGAGLVGLLSHFVTCGAALVPAGAALLGGKHAMPSDAPFAVEVLPHTPTRKDIPCELAFRLLDGETGHPLTPDELDTRHTKKIHTMIVDDSLTDYQHLHPDYDASRGVFTCRFTPHRQATYRMWNDFSVKGEHHATQLESDLSGQHGISLPARVMPTSRADIAGLQVQIKSASPLQAGTSTLVTCTVADVSGRPVTDLEPIMGAYAHLAGFSADGKHFIHCHPVGTEPQSAAERGAGTLQFHIQPETAGYTKFFLQIRRQGQEITVPFGQYIKPAEQLRQRIQPQSAPAGFAHA